ncbi:MAG: transporter ATP-binding protein [Paenibacillus sp.]|jgi:ABC-2 type transport system ATP-binding protein|nr:transporter ATP-binding protein [Paenibacillus sp.]
MVILEIKQLTKKYDDYIAVDQLSLRVQEGEILGLLGPNGAGKSTTIQLIVSLLRKTSGEIKLFGKELERHRSFAKKHVGIVPQELAIYEDMTAYENVHFFGGLYGLRGAELMQNAEEALAFVGLRDRRNSYPSTFSGGMKRRLNIACAIVHKPKLIIMDEPTVGIDPQSRNYILASVRNLNEAGSTIIYTSHYMEEVEQICSRIVIMDHGKMVAEGTKEQLKAIIMNTKDIWIEVQSTESLDTSRLKEIQGVNSVEAIDHMVKINTELAVNNHNKVIQQLISQQIEIRSVRIDEPNLETVFLTLTGRNLRD